MSGDLEPTASFAKPTTTDGQDAPLTGWRRWVNLNVFGIALMLLACGWSLSRVLSISNATTAEGVIELRIAHWQLESGYRDALDAMIAEYIALHPDKKIVIKQDGVTERVYKQWLNVNLIAGNPPDIAEMGMAGLTNRGDSVAKYFTPLGREVSSPNPYNADRYLDELETRDEKLIARLRDAPWRETLMDGMRGGWRDDLQDYYSVPTSFFTQRMYYNTEMYAEVMGKDAPVPQTLGEFFAACDKMEAWAQAKGEGDVFDPIAANRHHKSFFDNNYRIPFTNVYQSACDYDLSCDIAHIESWASFQKGAAKIPGGARVDDPAYRSYLEAVQTIFSYCNAQFNALDRDQSIASFAQRRGAFLASGSWDAGSIFLACDFEVGVFKFPMPAEGERFGGSGRFPLSEAAANGGALYGIPKTCKHPEIALDFLRFLTSHKYNQRFNRLNGFLPITIGTRPEDSMIEFMPNPYGVMSHLNFADGYDLQVRMSGLLDSFLLRESSFDAFVAKVDEAMADKRNGFDRIWYKTNEKVCDNVRSLERTIAVLTSRDLFSDSGVPDALDRARGTILDQALLNQGGNIRLLHAREIGGSFPEAP